MLDILPYLLRLFMNNTDYEDKAEYLISLFVLKALSVIILGGYVVFNSLVYYSVPIDISFDIAGNNFLSIYNIVVVFLTALVAYVIIERSFQSPISIFSNARDIIENDNPKKIEGQCFDH